MGRIGQVLLAILILLNVSGCLDERIIEDLGFIHTIGYDLVDDGKNLQVTITIPQVDPTSEKFIQTQTAISNSPKDGRSHFARKSERVIVKGQLRNALYSTDVAKEGLIEVIDTLIRDPFVGLRVEIVVVDGNVNELLTTDYPEHPRVGRYINLLIEREARFNVIPEQMMYQFVRDYHDDGIDPIAPIIKMGKGEIVVDGIALFDGDKYKSKLEPISGRVFHMLRDDYRGGDVSIALIDKDDDEATYKDPFVTFSFVESKKRVKVRGESPEDLTIELHIDVDSALSEYTGHQDLLQDKHQLEIERAFTHFLHTSAKEMVEHMQEHNTDALGLGQYVRNSMSYDEWQALNWKEVFPNVAVEYYFDVKIKRIGTLR